MEKARLFVGTFLDAEPARVISNLKEINAELSTRWRLKARFVPLPKLHLTWLFIGDVERDLVDTVKSDLENTIEKWKQNIQNQSFEIAYDQIEVWSSLKSPRVLVLESTKICPQAESLNSAITEGLGKYCQTSEENSKIQRFKRFRPHLTVCRFSLDSDQKGAGHVKRSLTDFETPHDLFPLIHKIGTVSLIESDLNAGPNGYASIQDLTL